MMDNTPPNRIDLPDWLTVPGPSKPQQASRLPDWLSVPAPKTPKKSPERKALNLTEYEVVFPRILEMLGEGYTLKKAVKELPIEISEGALLRWINADQGRKDLYKEAKELRTEAWAGKIIEHAEGVDDEGNVKMEDVSRSKLIVDTYWKLMGADNRKQYGDTKTIDVTGGISITAALQQANARIAGVVDAEFSEVVEPVLLTEGEDDDGDV